MKAFFLTLTFTFLLLGLSFWNQQANDEIKEYIYGSEDHTLTVEHFLSPQEQDPLQIEISKSPKHGLLEQCKLSETSEKFSCIYHPEANFYGADSGEITLTLKNSKIVKVPVDVFIKPTADKPIAESMDINLLKNNKRTFYVNLAEDPDTLQKDLQYIIINAPKYGLVDDNCFLGLKNQSQRSCTYTPDPEFSGKDSIQYIVEDEHGNKSEVQSIFLNIQEVDRSIAGESK